MLVQRHNIPVRHIGITMTRRRQVSLINIELAHAGQERFVRCLMTIHCGFLRFAHAGQFIVGLISAVVMQIIDHAFRVDFVCRNIQTQRALRNRTDVGDVATRSR
ncbi:hypothetical protein D3C80_1405900 [compost metagenome]